MLKIAITGANSFIASHLLCQLEDQKLLIHALSRTICNEAFTKANIISFTGNLLDYSSLKEFVKDCDIVINLAYLWESSHSQNIQAIENLARSCASQGIKRLIHCSSTSVYGNVKANTVDEYTVCNPQTNYAKTKLAIENYLLENYANSFEIAILRPSQVFGPRGKNLIKLADDLSNKGVFINYLKSCLMAKRPMNLVCVKNVVTAIEHLIYLNKINERIYIISDDECNNNYFQYVEAHLRNSLQIQKQINTRLSLPLFFYRLLYQLSGKGAINPKVRYLGINLRKEGYIKSLEFEESLANFASWYNTSKKR